MENQRLRLLTPEEFDEYKQRVGIVFENMLRQQKKSGMRRLFAHKRYLTDYRAVVKDMGIVFVDGQAHKQERIQLELSL